ncbi:M48 family metalloprotease [Streptomyces kaniharaensis]|uniref:M48 family metalloprotease n=1 Tax=Streptomyces kaniharaensis TaxID=212423 RepID=A0A6N7KV50_9ACTN|nr:M48 family metalloprotease [Streptomyces kaniharaensis]MQS15506.1 M48 family metalloprotease [Streptomyces kaniharaensis]
MHIAVYLPLLFPLLAALVARSVGERLPPRLATWLLTVGSLVLASASTAVLGMLAVTGLIRIPLLARLAHDHWSAHAAQRHDPASFSVAVLAGVLLAAVAAMAVRMLWRRARALARAATEAACLPGRDQLVVIDDPAAEAYAIPGRPGRIVVSTGMLRSLEPAEHQILLAHERAHLAHHHYLFVALAQLAAAANPLLRPLAATVTFTVERWADESAATAVGDRERVARTIGKAAIAARRTRARSWIPSAALGILGRLRPRGLGPVPRRVTALLAPAPSRHAWSIAALAGLAVATALCVTEAAHDLEEFLELAKHASHS